MPLLDVCNAEALADAKRDAARRRRLHVHLLPMLCRLRVEAAMRQQPQAYAVAASRLGDLHARTV